MTRVDVRSGALAATATRLTEAADGLRVLADGLGRALARAGPPASLDVAVLAAWVRVEVDGARVVGPAGLWGAALGLDAVAVRLRTAARAYEEVEEAVAALLHGVRRGADAGARSGVLDESGSRMSLRPVAPTWSPAPLAGPADLVALGAGLDGGRVRVLELDDGAGGSAWVLVVPGTQEWDPRPGPNPFDVTTDLRAVTGDATLAAAGAAAALARARAGAGRASSDDPVLVVGHSQGGILAAALAADPGFTARHRVTHVVTTGAPVGVFAVPDDVRVLSVEHADDPVPTLDLTPNPTTATWLTLRVGTGPAADVGRHRLGGYVATTRAAEQAPRGTVPGLQAWEASAGEFLHRDVRSVTEVVVNRRPPDPARGPRP